MRFPNYLTCTPSGVFLFRIRVPADLRGIIGRDFIKQRIGRDLLTARRAALDLSSRYALAFDAIRGHGMTKDKTAEEIIRSVAESGQRDYVITTPSGIRIEAHDAADHARAMEAVDRIGYIGPVVSQPAPPPTVPTVAETITMAKARDAWIKKLEPNTLPKTLTIKAKAIKELTSFLGPSRELHTITRPDMARYFQHLRDKKLADPTRINRQSYLGGKDGFFAWAMASGYYPAGDNPATGHEQDSSRSRRRRKGLGFKAFDLDQVRTLYAPEAIAKLSPGARWAALLGLYTGARASEVGQLHTSDLIGLDETPAIRISDEGEGQRVKSEASLRTVPLHPDLLSLGFLDYVQRLKSRGDWRVFPQASTNAKNGAGNWISKAFSRHIEAFGVGWPKAKRGFHSLRKTAIQQMQGKAVASEMRAQIVGHELDDEHHEKYSRIYDPAEKLHGVREKGFLSAGLDVLDYGLDLNALRPLLTAEVSRRTANGPGRKPASTAAARKRASKSGGK